MCTIKNPFGQCPNKSHFALLRQVTHIETGFWQINLSRADQIRWNRQAAQFICCAAKGRRTGCTSMESMTGMYKGPGRDLFLSSMTSQSECSTESVQLHGDGSLGATDGFRGEASVVVSLYCRSTLRSVQLSDSSSGWEKPFSLKLSDSLEKPLL